MNPRTANALTASLAGLGCALSCGWLCFAGLQRLFLPLFLWGTPFAGGGLLFVLALAAAFGLWAWKADAMAAADVKGWLHGTQCAALVLSIGAAAACHAEEPLLSLAPACLAACGALECALWCGLLLTLTPGMACAALVAGALCSAALAGGLSLVPPAWLPWLLCFAVAQSWPLTAWCVFAGAASLKRGRGRPPGAAKENGPTERWMPGLFALAFCVLCLGETMSAESLPLWAYGVCFAVGGAQCGLEAGRLRGRRPGPELCLLYCCGILLPGVWAAAALSVAEGCLCAAVLLRAARRVKNAARPAGVALCCAALLGNAAAQLGLAGAQGLGLVMAQRLAAAVAALLFCLCAVPWLRLLRASLVRRHKAARPAHPALDGLTPQEWQVFTLVGRECSNRDIAERLKISEPTVRFHLRSIYKKTGKDGRPGLEAMARQHAVSATVSGKKLCAGER